MIYYNNCKIKYIIFLIILYYYSPEGCTSTLYTVQYEDGEKEDYDEIEIKKYYK